MNIDISVYKDGFHSDLNETFCVGTVDAASKQLIKSSYESLMAAVAMVAPNTMVRDFGKTISKIVGKAGFSVVKTYCGHGIGKLFHGAPNVPHYASMRLPPFFGFALLQLCTIVCFRLTRIASCGLRPLNRQQGCGCAEAGNGVHYRADDQCRHFQR